MHLTASRRLEASLTCRSRQSATRCPRLRSLFDDPLFGRNSKGMVPTAWARTTRAAGCGSGKAAGSDCRHARHRSSREREPASSNPVQPLGGRTIAGVFRGFGNMNRIHIGSSNEIIGFRLAPTLAYPLVKVGSGATPTSKGVPPYAWFEHDCAHPPTAAVRGCAIILTRWTGMPARRRSPCTCWWAIPRRLIPTRLPSRTASERLPPQNQDAGRQAVEKELYQEEQDRAASAAINITKETR
jgi:hypothetical protein